MAIKIRVNNSNNRPVEDGLIEALEYIRLNAYDRMPPSEIIAIAENALAQAGVKREDLE